MKINERILLMVFGVLAFTVISCSDDDDAVVPPPTADNIVDIAASTPELSTLVEALTMYPDLVNTLSAPGTFTVFAPDNNAFAAVLGAIGQSSLDDVSPDVLEDILEYHVASSAALFAADLSDGQTVGMVNGSSVVVSLPGNGVLINDAQVSTADIEASNGVIHIVNSVLIPPAMLPVLNTIVAPVFFDKDFTTLVAAVQAADPAILSLLISAGPAGNGLTLFAPTNEAFEAAGITELPDEATLNAVLRYHVLDGTVTSGDLPAGGAEIQTLNGKFNLSNVDAGVFINGKSQVTEVDITEDNGVVHVINRTLLPPSQNIAEIVVASAGADPAEFTLLLAAVQTAGLTDVLAGEGAFTVFAPTDAAFNKAGFPDVASVEAADPALLTAILTHHVVDPTAVPIKVFSTDLTDGQVVPMFNEQNITVNLQDLTIQDAFGSNPPAGLVVDLLDINATNGVIHVIDEVLLPAQ